MSVTIVFLFNCIHCIIHILFSCPSSVPTATHAGLEAAHADDKARITALRQVEATLRTRVADLEKERSALLCNLESTSTEHSGRVQALTQELERAAKEKEDMRLQYAREIEGAQTQLSVREQELAEERYRALQETRQQLNQEVERLKVGTTAHTHASTG